MVANILGKSINGIDSETNISPRIIVMFSHIGHEVYWLLTNSNVETS